MTMRPRQCALNLTIAFALSAAAPIAHGQVYKCTDAAGKTTYADAPCAAGSKPLKLPDDGRKTPTDPNMCAQLKDETQRLAAEAERNAQRGRPESAGSAKRRNKINDQYAARCVGIARSGSAQR